MPVQQSRAVAVKRSRSELQEGDELLHVVPEWNSAMDDAVVALIIANLPTQAARSGGPATVA